MTHTVRGRRVAVTGAASGIGAATAHKLMADGWRVACLDRNSEGARTTAGGDGLAVPIDVADEASTATAFATVREAFGGLDALITAAGVIETTPFLDTTVAQFRRLFDINVIGSFLSVREGAKLMQPGGRICMVASISSYTGGGYVATGAYATSKGAVLTMMKSCARALGEKGIAVNAVAPGFIATEMTESLENGLLDHIPAKRTGTPEEVAACVRFLASEEAGYVTGTTLTVDGGLSA